MAEKIWWCNTCSRPFRGDEAMCPTCKTSDCEPMDAPEPAEDRTDAVMFSLRTAVQRHLNYAVERSKLRAALTADAAVALRKFNEQYPGVTEYARLMRGTFGTDEPAREDRFRGVDPT